MAKFRKKPVVIEAFQYQGDKPELVSWMKEVNVYAPTNIEHSIEKGEVYIPTLEGMMTASKGDFIICGVKGEFYPCKPDIFEATYEVVEN